MDVAERRRLIEQYKDGYRVVAEALAGATEAELDAREGPDGWSAREVAHHLADGEMTSAIRLRRLIAEEHPQIAGYDEAEFARRPSTTGRSRPRRRPSRRRASRRPRSSTG
jgi:hypothetical protein